jgi:hypothetical protein
MPEEPLLFASRLASRTALARYLGPETPVIRYASQRSNCAECGNSLTRLLFGRVLIDVRPIGPAQ